MSTIEWIDGQMFFETQDSHFEVSVEHTCISTLLKNGRMVYLQFETKKNTANSFFLD